MWKDEIFTFSQHINYTLFNNNINIHPQLKALLPIDPLSNTELFNKLKNGIILKALLTRIENPTQIDDDDEFLQE